MSETSLHKLKDRVLVYNTILEIVEEKGEGEWKLIPPASLLIDVVVRLKGQVDPSIIRQLISEIERDDNVKHEI